MSDAKNATILSGQHKRTMELFHRMTWKSYKLSCDWLCMLRNVHQWQYVACPVYVQSAMMDGVGGRVNVRLGEPEWRMSKGFAGDWRSDYWNHRI